MNTWPEIEVRIRAEKLYRKYVISIRDITGVMVEKKNGKGLKSLPYSCVLSRVFHTVTTY